MALTSPRITCNFPSKGLTEESSDLSTAMSTWEQAYA